MKTQRHLFSLNATLSLALTLNTLQALLPAQPISGVLPGIGHATAQSMQKPTSKTKAQTLVILPFKNITQNPEDQWLQESFSENLTMGLGQGAQLKLVERSDLQRILREQQFSQSAYVESESAPKVGQMLGANYAVLGNYQRVGDHLLVNVKVVDTETGVLVEGTATQVKGTMAELFDLQEQLAERLSQKLYLKMSGQTSSGSPQPVSTPRKMLNTTRSTAAHEAYIKARLLREELGDANLSQAIALLQSALSIDPDYALAASELAGVYYDRANGREVYRSATPEDLSLAERFAQKAVVLAPESAHGYAMLSKVLAAQKKNAAALTLAQRALELEPTTESILSYVHLKYPQFFEAQNPQVQSVVTHSESSVDPETLVQEIKALGGDLSDPQMLFTLGGLYFSQIHHNPQAKIDRALDYYQQAHAKNPHNPFYAFTLSAVYMLQDVPQKAENILTPLMENNPGNLRLLVSGAQAAQRLLPDLGKMHSEKKILQRFPDYTLAYFHLSTLYAQQDKTNPDNVILLLTGAQALQKLLPEAALRWSRAAIEHYPTFAEAYFQLAQLYLQQGKDPQQADLWFNQGLEHIQGDPNAAYGAARYLMERGDLPRAQQYLSQALNHWQNAAQQGDLTSGAQFFLSLNTQAQLFLRQQQPQKALNAYRQVAESPLPPLQKGLAYQRMAEIYAQLNQHAEAVKAYQNYLDYFPKSLQNVQAHNIYQGYFAQQKLKQAPKDPTLLNNAGQAFLARGEYATALVYLHDAQRFAPENAVIAYNLGLAHLGLKDWNQATHAFAQAIALNPKYSKAHYNLGIVYYQQGDLDKARQHWQRAVELNPEFEAARQALEALR